jgi:ATP-dependent RNA helicase DeaD
MTKTPPASFDQLGLSSAARAAINKKGFEEPTAIQAMTIPAMLRNDTDLIAQAQTGTGKTAAFGLPLLDLLDPRARHVQALILAPTRELAIQVAEEINSLKTDASFTVVPIYGGQSIEQQLRRLKKGIHIVVGTPGRVIDHLHRGTLKVDRISHLILDEADEMLNMGFIDDMKEIMSHTPTEKRTLLFSATMPDKIKQLARTYMKDHTLLKDKHEPLTTNLTEQIYFEVHPRDKLEALCRIIDSEETFYGLVFCRTKSKVDELGTKLADRGYDAASIHGDISQAGRERILGRFKQQKINVLVATDVAARGIDVRNLTHVINYSLPQDPEMYVHRIGRTGRAGNEGTAITFISPSEYKALLHIQRIAGINIKKSKLPQVDEIIAAKKKKIYEDVTAQRSESIEQHYHDWARQFLENRSPVEVCAALLKHCFKDTLDTDSYDDLRSAGQREAAPDQRGKARLFVALGKKDKASPKKIAELVGRQADIDSSRISDIRVMETFSFITVPFAVAEKIIAAFKGKGPRPVITHARKKSAPRGKK